MSLSEAIKPILEGFLAGEEEPKDDHMIALFVEAADVFDRAVTALERIAAVAEQLGPHLNAIVDHNLVRGVKQEIRAEDFDTYGRPITRPASATGVQTTETGI